MSYKNRMMCGMETKMPKARKLWWLVTTYYLTVSIVASVLLFLVATLLVVGVGDESLFESQMGKIGIQVLSLIFTVFTAWYAAGYLKKTSIIPDPKKVVAYSVLVSVIVTAVFLGVDYLTEGYIPDALHFVFVVVDLVVFYLASKKFLDA